jgi:uncharacterized membrane protein YbhN (UPF0104 family)
MSSETDQHFPESDQKQLCLSCMAPNEVSANFCSTCKAPLSSYASTGPFEHLFAEGAVYRQAAERPRKLFVVLGVWILFGTVMLSAIGWSIAVSSQSRSAVEQIIFSLFDAAMAAVSGAMIWRTTRNYLGKSRQS